MNLYNMKNNGIITQKEFNTLAQYTDLTDAIITYKNGVYKISTPQENLFFSSKSKLMKNVNDNLFYIIDALKEIESDQYYDGLMSDVDMEY